MFKNVRLVIYFDMILNPSFKITTSFANIATTTANTSKLMSRKDIKPAGLGLYMKSNL